MKRFMGHKWVVVVAALILVLAVGAVAWAATSDSTTTSTTAVTNGGSQAGPGPGLFGLGEGRGDCKLWPGNEQMRKNLEQKREVVEARAEAWAKLVRDKMSSEDQKKFDQLIAQIKSQRETLQKAGEALQDTAKQLNDLVDKYLGSASGSTTTTTQSS